MITIVVPVYNEEKTIEDVLKLVSESPIVNEIVIVNDFSTDNTKEILDNNKLLPKVLSSIQEISIQLNLLSKKIQIKKEFFLYLILERMRLLSHILESLIHLIQFKKMIY